MRFATALSTAMLAASPCMAAPPQPLPSVRKASSYADARGSLIRSGWVPIPIGIGADDCGLGRSDVCAAYPETEFCSGTGRALCSFAWRKRATIIQVMTYGEELPDLRVEGIRCREGCN